MLNLKTILVCADIKTQQTLSDFLRMFGYDVIKTTQYGFDCVSDVLKNKPDVIICDAFIYDLDACRLYEELRSAGCADDLVFVVASSVTDSSFINEVLGCGADMFTLLPTDFFSLDKKIRLKLDEKRAANSADPVFDEHEFRIRTHIKTLIHELGHSTSFFGYEYIIEAVYMLVNAAEDEKLPITKVIYPSIAGKYHTKPGAVERAIRSAIEKAWLIGNVDLINDIFGYSVDAEKGMPSNTPYIKAIAERVKMDLKIQ